MESGRPRISILINNYNYAQYLGEAIASALAQTYPHTEVIVVDDGSSDNSADVARQFSGIRTIFKPNGGQTSAVRAGLAAASGDIVILLDSDDLLYPEACASIADAWDEETSYVQFRLRLFSSENPDIGVTPPDRFVTNHKTFFLRHGRFPYAPTSGNAFSRKWAMRILDVTQTADRSFCDMILAMCSALCGKVAVIDRCLGAYRVHQKNTSWRVGLKGEYNVARDAEQRIRTFAAHMGIAIRKNQTLTGPYFHQWAVKLYLTGDPDISPAEARKNAFQMIRSFLTFPGLPLKARVSNLVVAAVVILSPPLARWLFAGSVKWSNSPIPQARAK